MAELLTAGLAAVSASISSALQGPENGSPFVNAPLPFEEIKAAPDRALEVILLTVGVMFLAGLATAAFLALSKLRSIEETVEKELRQLREASAERTASDSPPVSEEVLLRIEASLPQSVAEVKAAIEAAIEAAGGQLGRAAAAAAASAKASGPPFDAALQAEGQAALGGRLEGAADALVRAAEAQERASEALAERLPSIGGLREGDPGASGSDARGGSTDGSPSRRGAVLDRIHARLIALGFSEIEIVTPRDELAGERLLEGPVQVEARRSGAVHKGAVTLEDGSPVDVQLRPSHSIFP